MLLSMGFAAVMFLQPAQPNQLGTCTDLRNPFFIFRNTRRQRRTAAPVARLFRPSIFEESKLNVQFLGAEEGKLPRAYTLTHSDITSRITLAISDTVNHAQLQGWYNRLQRDEVVAEWKKVQEKMSLHVHCHISGGHFLLDVIAGLRYHIFCKELPVVLKAFVHGDESLFSNHPELESATVWVYFHSNLPEFNRVECWGPLQDAASEGRACKAAAMGAGSPACRPQRCMAECSSCFPGSSYVSWSHGRQEEYEETAAGVQLQR